MGRPRKQFQPDVKTNIAIMAVFAILIAAIGGPVTAIAQEADAKAPSQKKSKCPQIVKTSPVSGSTDVKTAIKEIKVTFDREMSGGMSWTGGPPLLPPVDKRRKA